MASRRIGGIIEIKANGEIYDAKGNFTYNLGKNKREAVVGMDRTHGYKEEPQVAMIEGAITDRNDLDVATLLELCDATITLTLANGKVVVLRDAWFAGEGNITTEEGEIEARFEGIDAEEIR